MVSENKSIKVDLPPLWGLYYDDIWVQTSSTRWSARRNIKFMYISPFAGNKHIPRYVKKGVEKRILKCLKRNKHWIKTSTVFFVTRHGVLTKVTNSFENTINIITNT